MTTNKIWYKEFTVEWLNKWCINTMCELIGMEFTEIGNDYLKAIMPVDKRTHQPAGLLHGGASVVLSETLGSAASNMCINQELFAGVGLEVNANHIKAVKSGFVTGICSPIHLGKKTHVWDIKIYNDKNELNCISRLTVAIINKNS